MNILQLISNLKQSIAKQWGVPSSSSQSIPTPVDYPKTKLETVTRTLNTLQLNSKEIAKNARIFRETTSLINAKDTIKKSNEIRNFGFKSYNYYLRVEQAPPQLKRLCFKVPDLSFFLLHSYNGYDRELALKHIDDELSSFEAMNVLNLTNNWVDEVRLAAIEAVERCFPKTDVKTIASILPVFIKNSKQWMRWDTQHRSRIQLQLLRPDIVELLVSELTEQPSPYAVRIFNYLLQGSDIDGHLEQIRLRSKNPSIRAIATETLLFGEAKWKNGYTDKWVDKSFGVYRREPVIVSRSLSVSFPKEPIITEAFESKFWRERKVAADALIKYRAELDLPIKKMAQQLLKDTYPSIQERGKFLLSALDQH